MPIWPNPRHASGDVDVVAHAREIHQAAWGVAPRHLADAPATYCLMGDHVDHAGGVVVMGLADLRAAVAISPRTDETFEVRMQRWDAVGQHHDSDSTTMTELAQLAAAQQPGVDENGKTIVPDLPRGGLAHRLGGIVWTMIHRQLLSRETQGMNISVSCAIPTDSGLGAYAAIDAAMALALQAESPDLDHAPLRAKLAEICSQAGETFWSTAILRARHSAALRGEGATVSVLDYADGSLTQAPHPLNDRMAAFAVTVPVEASNNASDAEGQSDEIRQRQRFVNSACHAFGTTSLRALPDAPQRVADWLRAVHKVHGHQGVPSVADAQAWLYFYRAETSRTQDFATALRSRRGEKLWPLVQASQQALTQDYVIDASEQLAQLALVRGAQAARAAAAGTSLGVIAYIPRAKAEEFAESLASDGLTVTPLHPGARAELVE